MFKPSFKTTLFIFIILILTVFNKANAYIPIRTSTGQIGHWNQGQNIKVRTNERNQSGLTSAGVYNIFTTSLNRWKQAALNVFDFSYYQGSDPSRFPVFSGVTSDNSVFFTSQSNSQNQLPCGIVGMTQLYFDQNSGQFHKFDMRFNDNCYLFTTDPRSTRTGNMIYLGDVASHELGHAMGLDHSQHLQSTMIFTAAIEMSHPSCDDIAGIRAVFGMQNASITGLVLSPAGAPLNGAHINAVSLDRGIVLSSAITNSNGNYTITGLEEGSYAIVAEPFYPGKSALSPFYAGMNANVCQGGATKFERSFLTEALNGTTVLKSVSVAVNSTQNAGTLIVNCSQPSSVNANKESQLNTAPILLQSAIVNPVGVHSVLSSNTNHYYRLNNQMGSLEIHALSYTLFSNIDVRVEALNTSGQILAQFSSPNTTSSNESGFINFDSFTKITLASMQDIIIRVVSEGYIPINRFPSGQTGVSLTPYYVVTVSDGSRAPALLYPEHSRCTELDQFGAYPNLGDPGSTPGLSGQQLPQAEFKNSKTAGCGQLFKREQLKEHDPLEETALILNFIIMICIVLTGRKFLQITDN